ncbi:hypothetical protein B0H12DRAFT_1329264 [Mycena haematopus]|nr:hypothetical protein B0H12DRAFT_1329264 [Mycena haematopus]
MSTEMLIIGVHNDPGCSVEIEKKYAARPHPDAFSASQTSGKSVFPFGRANHEATHTYSAGPGRSSADPQSDVAGFVEAGEGGVVRIRPRVREIGADSDEGRELGFFEDGRVNERLIALVTPSPRTTPGRQSLPATPRLDSLANRPIPDEYPRLGDIHPCPSANSTNMLTSRNCAHSTPHMQLTPPPGP